MTNQTDQDNSFEPASDGITSRRRLWIETGLVIAFWTCLFLLTMGERAVGPDRPSSLWSKGLAHTAFENVLWLLATPGFFWLTRRYSLEQATWSRSLPLYLAAAFGAAVAVDYVSHVLFPVFPQPYTLARSLSWLGFIEEFIIALVVLMAGVARAYFLQFQARQKEALRYKAQASALQAQLADARLSALRMQINPHFLFNTLNSISSLADESPEAVQRIVARLSALLRRALEGDANQEVPLAKELSFIRDYLEIQRVRFDEQLEVVEHTDENVQDALVPDLILQPLVENAIKHGATAANGHAARIVLGARRDPDSDRLVLTVRDNGPGLDEGVEERAAQEGRVGLANTRKRLDALYGAEASLDLTNAPEGGLIATITLPYHTAADLRSTPNA